MVQTCGAYLLRIYLETSGLEERIKKNIQNYLFSKQWRNLVSWKWTKFPSKKNLTTRSRGECAVVHLRCNLSSISVWHLHILHCRRSVVNKIIYTHRHTETSGNKKAQKEERTFIWSGIGGNWTFPNGQARTWQQTQRGSNDVCQPELDDILVFFFWYPNGRHHSLHQVCLVNVQFRLRHSSVLPC